MAQIDGPMSIEDIFSWFGKLEVVTNLENAPERNLILMLVLGIRTWVAAETKRVTNERNHDFNAVIEGRATRISMDQWNDALCLLVAGIEKRMGIFTRDDSKWQLLYNLSKECDKTITALNDARREFHPPMT